MWSYCYYERDLQFDIIFGTFLNRTNKFLDTCVYIALSEREIYKIKNY